VNYYGFDWIGTVFGLASIHYLGQRRRVGFVLRIIASIFWVLFGVVAKTPAGVIANVAVIFLSLKGLRAWRPISE
jgi:nicotinamide riboside transporter PnuC